MPSRLPSDPPDEGRHSYHHGDLAPALVRAAEKLVAGHGAEEVSLRAIAREAGVTHAALYHHFSDRQELLAAVAASGFRALRQSMLERAESAEGPPLTQLQEAGVAYVLFATRNPHLYRLMFRAQIADRHRYPDLQEAADAAYAALGSLLSRTGAGQSAMSEDHPAGRAAWGTVHGLAMLLVDGRVSEGDTSPETVERITREVTTVLGRGLRSLGDAGRQGDADVEG